ncbi:hypothetical protein MAPG_03227 [Magnaporthiopsis poae ATCC 64411]|uniref:PWWP domain-containing protein n=1 Tax=Magnaporthiopsis poae (strain ATCC 64411 / 73-15) TaxID=644358 RepID=A0A0C4DTG0_MAGP6|nr:hypothetical protein MAPG_03227 [Magnaporthiopsis poae ATCC 64411]
MSDSTAPAAQTSAQDAQPSGAQAVQDPPATSSGAKTDDAADTKAATGTSADDAPKQGDNKSAEAKDAPATPTDERDEKGDTTMKDASDAVPDTDGAVADGSAPTGASAKTEDAAPDAATDDGEAARADAAKEPTTPADKSKARRKSTSLTDSRKKLNRKGSRAKILHLDAKPGDYFFIRLKGYPLWPGIICDEDMLPQTLLKTRPVTAARPDGTYREDFADGGKRVADRTFPVMYLYTNEFGWIPNQDLVDLDTSTVASLASPKMRKDLQAAHELAGEGHDLQHFKDLLIKHQEDILNEEKQAQEQQAAKAEAKAAAAAKKAKKAAKEAEEDVEMADADEDDIGTPAKEKKPSKKRKAEDDAATPHRSDSVKKPKIKLTTNSTPKAANGISTPKSPKPAAETKASKSKTKKPAKEVAEPKKTADKKMVEKETEIVMPELSPEEKLARKEKEVLFLRHKLQKGLLTRDQEPKEDEMKAMSDYIQKLEVMPELEVGIIRATKINKVLKAILKLDNIPKEDEFKFKPRSKELLDKWTKLLAEGGSAPAKGAVSNGVNGAAADSKTGDKDTAVKAEGGANGVKANGDKKAETPSATEPATAGVGKVKDEVDEKKPEVTEAVEATA